MKRQLRKPIDVSLTTITMILILFLLMIDDIELGAIPFLAGIIAIIVFNICILKKYGKGVFR